MMMPALLFFQCSFIISFNKNFNLDFKNKSYQTKKVNKIKHQYFIKENNKKSTIIWPAQNTNT